MWSWRMRPPASFDTDQARELLEAVNEQLGSESIQFYPGAGHRHLMVWVEWEITRDMSRSSAASRPVDRRRVADR